MTGPQPAGGPVLPPLAPVSSRSGVIADAIRTAILQGQFAPGQTLVERSLAAQLGVSKTPVREALIALSSTGLVTVSLNRGVSVRRLDLSDIRKIYELRLLLEPWAIGRATRRRTAATDRAATEALDEARTLLAPDDHAALSLANRRFHRALYTPCDNELVTTKLDELQDLTALGVVSQLWERWPTWRDEFAEHETLLAAVLAGDAPTAERLARSHVRQSLTRMDRKLDA
jgi:DNA-binding GntR family transcriptional regulator